MESTHCTECGADLSRRRALRVGHRRRRRRPLAVALILLVVAAAPLAAVGWGQALGVNWNRLKPGGWLVREAKGRDGAVRDAALAELMRRIDAGTLSGGNVAALTGHALAEQGDPAEPWLPAWGEAVERARRAGKVTDEHWARYLRQSIGPEALTLYIGPADRSGFEVSIRRGKLRLGRGSPELIAFFSVPRLEDWGERDPNWHHSHPQAVHTHASTVGWSRSDTIWPGRLGGQSVRQTLSIPVRVRLYELPSPSNPDSGGGREVPEPHPRQLRAEAVIRLTGNWNPGNEPDPVPAQSSASSPLTPTSPP